MTYAQVRISWIPCWEVRLSSEDTGPACPYVAFGPAFLLTNTLMLRCIVQGLGVTEVFAQTWKTRSRTFRGRKGWFRNTRLVQSDIVMLIWQSSSAVVFFFPNNWQKVTHLLQCQQFQFVSKVAAIQFYELSYNTGDSFRGVFFS